MIFQSLLNFSQLTLRLHTSDKYCEKSMHSLKCASFIDAVYTIWLMLHSFTFLHYVYIFFLPQYILL